MQQISIRGSDGSKWRDGIIMERGGVRPEMGGGPGERGETAPDNNSQTHLWNQAKATGSSADAVEALPTVIFLSSPLLISL